MVFQIRKANLQYLKGVNTKMPKKEHKFHYESILSPMYHNNGHRVSIVQFLSKNLNQQSEFSGKKITFKAQKDSQKLWRQLKKVCTQNLT